MTPSPHADVPDAGMPDAVVPDPAWLRGEAYRLLDGARAARVAEGGFAWLDADGRPERRRPPELWITTRMTHCFALGTLLGRDGDAALADHGIAALTGPFADGDHGGWYPALPAAEPSAEAPGPPAGRKEAYGHAFVLLAAAGATVAGRPGARDLLDRATAVVLERFWDERDGALAESFAPGWTGPEPYRGANANMHAVEAFLAVADATGDPAWLDRALRIAARLVDGEARRHGWRLPEHFTAGWTALPDYNADAPAHPFRPFGVTPGHGLEWARLVLTLAAALDVAGRPVPPWAGEAATGLYDRAVTDGWDGEHGGFAYTTDWSGVPVVRARFHWVSCEAIAAAHALHAATGDPRYAADLARFWAHARATFLDGRPGWRHEADALGRPSEVTWQGRPDVYHALQACLIRLLPPAASFAAAAARADLPA